MFKLSWQLHRSKRWKLLACQLSTVLYKNVLKEAGGKRYLPLLFLPFIPRIERVATAATSVGVETPGVEIAGAPSVVSRVSPLLLCPSAIYICYLHFIELLVITYLHHSWQSPESKFDTKQWNTEYNYLYWVISWQSQLGMIVVVWIWWLLIIWLLLTGIYTCMYVQAP